MEARELRIGNLVWLSDKQKVWEILDGHEIDKCDESPFSQPIPLTEEWLLKLGFEKDTHTHKWSLPFNLQKVECSFEIDNKFTRYFQPDFMATDIIYVHQLQNLYYALTGQELTLN